MATPVLVYQIFFNWTSADDWRGITVTAEMDVTGSSGANQCWNRSLIVKYNSSGTKQHSSDQAILALALPVTPVAMSMDRTYFWWSGWPTNAGGLDTFVVKYNSSGVKNGLS